MPTSFTKIRIAQKDVKEIQNVVEEVGVLFLRAQPFLHVTGAGHTGEQDLFNAREHSL